MSKTKSSEEYVNLSDNKVKKIIKTLQDMKYTQSELETRVLPYVAQWLFNQGIAIESTCLILSSVIDISSLEDTVQNIYDEIIPPYSLSMLEEFLTNKEYDALNSSISNTDLSKTIFEGEIDDTTNVVINFGLKQVLQEKVSSKKGVKSKFTPIIEAVPKKLVVYDSPLTDQPRNFKITFTSNFSERDFMIAGEGTGATIKEISNYLTEAGYSHNPKFVDGALACMINTLISNGFADVRTDIDNAGVYFDDSNEKVLVIGLDFKEPTPDEMIEAIDVLTELHSYFKDNSEIFSSVFKWGLMSVFDYSMKQVGNWIPWLYLHGTAGAGKTTLAEISLYLYGIPSEFNTMGGSSFNTDYRIGNRLSEDCTARLVNEPAEVFKKTSTQELVKVCVESITARKIHGKVYPAFSPVIFTANNFIPDDDALLRRMYVLAFTHNLRKSNNKKKQFKEKFHTNTPKISPLQILNVFGRFAIREIIADPSRLFDDWQTTADFIVNKFFSVANVECPQWLCEWAESETLDDFDISQRENIRNFFVNEFNMAKKKVVVYDENGAMKGSTLDQTEATGSLDFEDISWSIVNNRMLTWAIPHTSRWGENNICITQGLIPVLKQHMDYSNNLKSLAELMGWEYSSVSVGGKSQRVIKILFDDFIAFMYPTFEFGDADE